VAEGDVELLEQGLDTAALMCSRDESLQAILAAEGGLNYLASFYRRRFPEV
jgi:hypothetical protein